MPSEQTPNDRLAALMRSQGLTARLDPTGVFLPDWGHRMRARVVRTEPRENALTLEVEIELELWPGRVLVEPISGTGRSEVEAMGDALRSFSLGALPVILGAFFGVRDHDIVSFEEWEIGGARHKVTLGRESRRGPAPRNDPDWLRAMADAARRLGLAEGTHTLRAFVGRNGSGPPTCEVLVDGEPWEEVESELRKLPWPAVSGPVTLRRFLIVRGGLDVGEAIARIAENADLEDRVLQGVLLKRGFSPRDASRAVAFVPLAFGRVLLASLGVKSGDMAEIRTGRSQRSAPLSDDPAYAAALRLAQQAFTDGSIPKERFSAIALRSAEAHLATEALNAGQRPEEIELPVPTIVLEQGTTPGAREKPWWKFW